jgi:hypothetical protein
MTRTTFWSPMLLAVALAPAFLHLSSCGNPHLTVLEAEADPLNRVVAFGTQTHQYNVWTDGGDTIVVRATTAEPSASVTWRLFIDGVFQDFQSLGTGGGEVTLTIPPGTPSEVELDVNHNGDIGRYTLNVNPLCAANECDDANPCTSDACVGSACEFTAEPDGTVCDFSAPGDGVCTAGLCEAAPVGFPCTEQGILDAIAAGGGPHTFACAGPTPLTLANEIVVDNDVILDGEGNLVLDGGGPTRVISVAPGVIAELRGFNVVGRVDGPQSGTGTLAIRDFDLTGILLAFAGTVVVERSTLTDDGVPISLVGAVDPLTMRIRDSLVVATAGPGTSAMQILAPFGSTTIENSTIMGSVATIDAQVLELRNVTVTGFLHVDSPSLTEATIAGTLILGQCVDVLSLTSLGNNIEVGSDTCFSDPTDQVNVTPAALNLGPLQDNGGPTETMLPGPGSVAIDTILPADCLDADGLPLTTDQRGISRPQGTDCDIGPVEVEQP